MAVKANLGSGLTKVVIEAVVLVIGAIEVIMEITAEVVAEVV